MFMAENFMKHQLKINKTFLAIISCVYVFAQPNTDVDLYKEKPQRYKERKLGSEKTNEKKFHFLRRFTQNTYTHYNYHFNAINKLNEVVERAKMAYKDDYTHLLPFYNYTIEATSAAKDDLDSVIYKCTAGILLHDLRNDWIDNLYMILGKAYLYKKDFDSAAGCFQYINHTYAPKDDGYDVPLGSNASKTKGVFTISTKEKNNFWKTITSRPPSRNESFIWQIRNYLEQDLLGEAAGLIGILRNDPNFPKRLKPELHEMTAYWFYKQANYDSASIHLIKALSNADNKAEKARWEFLAGQLFQLANTNDSMAIVMYKKAIKHTNDPLMEVYARLNMVSLASEKKQDALQENLTELLKLTKKERYADYRDIIYYAIAKIELQRNGLDAAQNYFLKSIKYSIKNPQQKTLSFIALGHLNYNRKRFIESHSFYDSVKLDNAKNLDNEEKNLIAKRKPALKVIAENMLAIKKEDSLQRIASMPEAERNIYVKKILKKLRKEKGLKANEEEPPYGATAVTDTKSTDMFSTDSKGDWYFVNENLKSKGFSEFKAKWGKRANIDNWRRQSSFETSTSTKTKTRKTTKTTDEIPDTVDDIGSPRETKDDATGTEDTEGKVTEKENEVEDLSFEGLMSKLPLDEERMTASHKKIQGSLFIIGVVFQDHLDEYTEAITNYQTLINKYSNFTERQKTFFNLYYCYTKLGMKVQADSVLGVLKELYPDGNFTQKILKGNTDSTSKIKTDEATKTYETIYNLFIEGKFKEAIEAKTNADKIYSKNYWTPQLLFIEAIYYVKQKDDSTATVKLKELIKLYPKTTLAAKAATMIDVLKRRKEIEDYLTKLEVERNEDPVTRNVDTEDDATVVGVKKEKKTNEDTKEAPDKSTTKTEGTKKSTEEKKGVYNFIATDQQYIMIVFNKVDNLFIKESKDAFAQFNRQKFYSKKINIIQHQLDEENTILLFGIFENTGLALEYYNVLKPQATTRIISFIPPNKYKYSIISQANFNILKDSKNLTEYYNFVQQILPDKF